MSWQKKRRKGVIVRARCIITDGQGRMLVQWDPIKEAYTVPGGRVEFRESIPLCLAREMKEEANIEVNPKKLVYVVEVLDSTVKPVFHEILFYFKCDYEGVPKNMNRYVKLEWRRPEEIKDRFWPQPLIEKIILDIDSFSRSYYMAIVDGKIAFIISSAG